MTTECEKFFSLKNKVIIVTGGGGFLGLGYARALAEAGASAVIWDTKNSAELEKLIAPLVKQGLAISADSIDITDETAVRSAVERVVEKFGHIDGLVNNAAAVAPLGGKEITDQFPPYEEYPLDLWERELKVNLTGTMIVTKAVAPIMMKQKSGSITNIASEVSVIAHDHRVYNDPADRRFKSIAYTTTKAAILGFTRQWAARLGSYNVRVNAFSPSGVETQAMPRDFVKRYGDLTMLGRMAWPGEYEGVVIFLCSDASSFITGHNLVADGGKSAW